MSVIKWRLAGRGILHNAYKKNLLLFKKECKLWGIKL